MSITVALGRGPSFAKSFADRIKREQPAPCVGTAEVVEPRSLVPGNKAALVATIAHYNVPPKKKGWIDRRVTAKGLRLIGTTSINIVDGKKVISTRPTPYWMDVVILSSDGTLAFKESVVTWADSPPRGVNDTPTATAATSKRPKRTKR